MVEVCAYTCHQYHGGFGEFGIKPIHVLHIKLQRYFPMMNT